MKEKFRNTKLSNQSLSQLDLINDIVNDYAEQGYRLTLRQLYYQLVGQDLIPNDQKEYKKLGRLLKEGRMAGIVDWEAIEDRLRKLRALSTWESPRDILLSAHNSFRLDCLQEQPHYIEVWVEKDALSQVVQLAAQEYRVSVLVNRGYGSVTAIYDTYQRLDWRLSHGFAEQATILYVGDHDPSGLDMVRDIEDRVCEMLKKEHRGKFKVEHIALTMDQINTYSPPPNPAKITDTRAKNYIKKYGQVSWEVDALPPEVLNKIIIHHIETRLDLAKFQTWKLKEISQKEQIRIFIENF